MTFEYTQTHIQANSHCWSTRWLRAKM